MKQAKKDNIDKLKINIEYDKNVSLKEVIIKEFEKEIINALNNNH